MVIQVKLYDPTCEACDLHFSDHVATDGAHRFDNCTDCGAEPGDEHSEKCDAYNDHYRDLAYDLARGK